MIHFKYWGKNEAFSCRLRMAQDDKAPLRTHLGYIKSRGVHTDHADCVCAPIVEDMIEHGIDEWQGYYPAEQYPGNVQKRVRAVWPYRAA
jgi:hypothetical protein